MIEAQYLPPIAVFSLLQRHTAVIVEKFEHYEKQTYRNRCYINTAAGKHMLVVPVRHEGRKVLTRDVRIDNSGRWSDNHWRTIRSAYGKAPFFEHYEEALHKVICAKHGFLYDLNLELMKICLSWLGYNIPVVESTSYQATPGTGINDFRSVVDPKKPDCCISFYKSVKYQQVFGSGFTDNLSIIDLIFCEGPGAQTIIRSSAVEMNK